MKPSNYKPRIVDGQIENALSTFGAVCVEGPKWCGKTWTSDFHAKSKIELGDPSGNFQNRQLAELDPKLVLGGDTPRLIDEWQEVPSIWDAVRYEVDHRATKGQFILTGSSTPLARGFCTAVPDELPKSACGQCRSMNQEPPAVLFLYKIFATAKSNLP